MLKSKNEKNQSSQDSLQKPTRPIPPIPEAFQSIEHIQDFWTENSSADYWDQMEDIDLELSPALKSKLELRRLYNLLGLSKEQVSLIEAKAATEKISSQQLISKWISEHV